MSPDRTALVDVVVAARNVVAFVDGMPWEQFAVDLKTQFAVQHQMIVIGEATKRLSLTFRDAHDGVQWREVAGLRDVLTHSYHRVSLRRVWEIAVEDIPQLIVYLEPLLPNE
jgi:uncharacterized protein with HEPN domain